MKKFVIYNTETDNQPTGVFTEDMLTNENGFTDSDIEEINNLDILETAVLDMNNIVLRVWNG